MGRKGFTLTELLVVISILAVMSVILVGILNPIALVNKGKDARRKKDLSRIKISFEEYYNDKGCYPTQTKINELADPTACGSLSVFAPWLTPWLCDPDGDVYEILIGGVDDNCPNMYRAFTTLENTKDKDIPEGWGVTAWAIGTDSPVNYGISSPNTEWYQKVGDFDCMTIFDGNCHYLGNSCEDPSGCFWSNTSSCSGDDCYYVKSQACKTTDCCEGYPVSCQQ